MNLLIYQRVCRERNCPLEAPATSGKLEVIGLRLESQRSECSSDFAPGSVMYSLNNGARTNYNNSGLSFFYKSEIILRGCSGAMLRAGTLTPLLQAESIQRATNSWLCLHVQHAEDTVHQCFWLLRHVRSLGCELSCCMWWVRVSDIWFSYFQSYINIESDVISMGLVEILMEIVICNL
jgi:hypothetical protein